jgi:hypothetical protein
MPVSLPFADHIPFQSMSESKMSHRRVGIRHAGNIEASLAMHATKVQE